MVSGSMFVVRRVWVPDGYNAVQWVRYCYVLTYCAGILGDGLVCWLGQARRAMMARYHVNPVTGDYGVCHAKKGKCPFGGASGNENHFGDEAKARQASEAIHKQRSTHGLSKDKSGKSGIPVTTGESYLGNVSMGELNQLVRDRDEVFKGYTDEEMSRNVDEAVSELSDLLAAQYGEKMEIISDRKKKISDFREKVFAETRARNESRARAAQEVLDSLEGSDGWGTKDLSEWARGREMRPMDLVKRGRYLETMLQHNPEVELKMDIKELKEYQYRGKPRIAILAQRNYGEYHEDYKFTFPADMVGADALKSNMRHEMEPEEMPSERYLALAYPDYQDMTMKQYRDEQDAMNIKETLDALDKSSNETKKKIRESYRNNQVLKRVLGTVGAMESVSEEEGNAWLRKRYPEGTELDVLAAGDGKVLVMTHTDKYAYYSDDFRVRDYTTYALMDADGGRTVTSITEPDMMGLDYTYVPLEDSLKRSYPGPVTVWNDRTALMDYIVSHAKDKDGGK